MSLFNQQTRRQLRLSLAANGVEADRIDELVDLSCHAADRAVQALSETACTASGGGQQFMVTEIAAQLAAAKLVDLAKGITALGVAAGLPRYEIEVHA